MHTVGPSDSPVNDIEHIFGDLHHTTPVQALTGGQGARPGDLSPLR